MDELNKKIEELTQAIELLKTPNSLVTQKTIKIFIDELYSKPPTKYYPTNKTCLPYWWHMEFRYIRIKRLWFRE